MLAKRSVFQAIRSSEALWLEPGIHQQVPKVSSVAGVVLSDKTYPQKCVACFYMFLVSVKINDKHDGIKKIRF